MRRDAWEKRARWPSRPPDASFLQVIDGTIMSAGQVKALQGRLAEAEVDQRRALLSRLKSVGKYHPTTAVAVRQFGRVIAAQGRYAEAEKLLRVAIEIYRSIGFAEASQPFLLVRVELAETLSIQSRWREAADVYEAINGVIADWPKARKARYQLRRSRIQTLYHTGSLATGIEWAKALADREKARVGERHPDFAMATAILAVGLARAGRGEEALAAFRVAIPLLTSASRAGEDEAGSSATRRDQQLRDVIEPYIALLARTSSGDAGASARETFGLADAIRGRSVQSALAAASARMVARDPALAELARKEQDMRKQVGAQFDLLNDVLSLPPAQRDDRAVAELRASIDRLRAERAAARAEIERRFPEYADLLEPKPPSIDEVRRLLRTDEALLSFYFGREHSFVWAVGKFGPVAFATIKATDAEIGSKVKALRAALEPNASTIDDIPPFDLGLAYELYALLLKPVEPAWKPAKNLIVVTNGAIGMLPLALLPTAPVSLTIGAKPQFAGYRAVPWLARTHAVTAAPSVAAWRTLRQLPAGSGAREALIGFGDPFFSAEQAAESARPQPDTEIADAATRGAPLRRRAAPQTQSVDSAELALLPRLPDTADELRSVALALKTEPAKVLHLGKAANETAVKSANLAQFRVLAFATHGLVPGDLNGLSQPALALSAPAVAAVPGDGLLTMEEILALKLDADWVVLSACNTGAGDGTGAEAASGLARAFFYAGTRAVLVTNWSVHSASARELVTDVFRRQAADPGITRGEALRQAMMALLDGPGFVDRTGKEIFAYAHPLFWAPYSIIGDGAGTQ
jgi:CHAT domain-containing protein